MWPVFLPKWKKGKNKKKKGKRDKEKEASFKCDG
jgi:hypothetical protein